MRKVLHVIVVLVALCVCSELQFANAAGTIVEADQVRELLLSHLTKEIVHARYRPVHLFTLKTSGEWLWAGSGTLILDSRGNPYKIITAGHIFGTNYRKGYYAYQVLVPKEEIIREISAGLPLVRKNTPSGSIGEDIAVLTPGSKQLIGSFSKHFGGVSNEARDVVLNPLSLMRKKELISLTTGERVKILGDGKFKDKKYGNGFSALGYEAENGESGSGFVDDQGALFVLSGSSPVNDQTAAILPEAKRYKKISFASSVIITN